MKKNGLEKEVVVLVLELAVGGELFDFMMYTGAFPEVIARTYFRQVRGFCCHEIPGAIVHRRTDCGSVDRKRYWLDVRERPCTSCTGGLVGILETLVATSVTGLILGDGEALSHFRVWW